MRMRVSQMEWFELSPGKVSDNFENRIEIGDRGLQ
jgi:hypothetical protein